MSTPRAAISHDTTLRLWVRAGGRCEYRGCNAYLLEDSLTAYTLNLADRAHIVGASDTRRSPRGSGPLAHVDRGSTANLMLLCTDHHRLIDTLIVEHTIEGLRKMKREHEERIRLLTDLQEDSSTVVVRAIGGIRDAPVGVPREAVLAAVHGDGRFPRFSLAVAGEDLEIDLRQLPDEGDPSFWAMGERIIVSQTARIREARQPIHHLSVFALMRIPLLIALGFHLDDKIPMTIYPRRRDGAGDGVWGFDPEGRQVEFEVTELANAPGASRVAVAISVTAPIGTDVVNAFPGGAIYEITPRDARYGRGLLADRVSLGRFAAAYHELLARIEDEHRDCAIIDLYAAVPVAGAIQLGRGLMRDAQPTLRTHDRDGGGEFIETLTLGRPAKAMPVSQMQAVGRGPTLTADSPNTVSDPRRGKERRHA